MSRALKDRFLRRVRRRMRLSWLAATLQHYAPFLLVALAGLIALDRLIGLEGGWTIFGIITAGLLCATGIVAGVMRVTDWDAARAAERGLDARDVLTTSLEFADDDDPFHVAIQQRAAEVMASSHPRQAIAIRVDDRRLRHTGVIAVAALVIGLIPPFGTTPALSADESTAIEAEAERIDQIAEAVEKAEVEGGDQLADELRRLAEELRQVRTTEEALRLLERADSRLEAGVDPDFLSRKAAVQGLARDLTLRPLPGAAASDAAGQFEEAAERLDELSEEELQALADRLRDLAASQAAGNPGLAGALSAASAALSEGNVGDARAALRNAAEGQRLGIGSARGQQALSESLRALAAARGRLAGQGGEGGAGGSGDGAGQGSGGDGSGGGGSGTISGVSPGEGGAAGQGGAGTPGSGSSQDGSSEVRTGTVFDPVGLESISDQLRVAIDGGSGEGAVIGRADGPTQRGDAIVPYTQVLPEYLTAAADALDALELPPSMRTIVQTYFDRLAAQAR